MTISNRYVENHLDYSHVGFACSVTQRVREISQPWGGFLNPKCMKVISLGDGIEALNPNESVQPALVGLAVDYLTRVQLGTDPSIAFGISKKGAILIGETQKANQLISKVKKLDRETVICATKLCGFDVCYRASPSGYKPIENIMPDDPTIENIIVMIKRALSFFDSFGPRVLDGFTFEGGYTNIISAGDGDFITADTLWDFKVSKKPINKDQTLQLLIYWRMGLHSVYPEFQNITHLGIFNPRRNMVYRIPTKDIPESIIKIIDVEVIGYKE